MPTPEFGEHAAVEQELFVGISLVAAEALLRSGLPPDVKYSQIELNRLHTPGEEITLSITYNKEDGYIVTLLENPRLQDHDEEVFSIGPGIDLSLREDGTGLAFEYPERSQGMTLAEAAEHITRRLPDFNGASGVVWIAVPEAQ